MPSRFRFRSTRCSTFVLLTDIVRFEGSDNYTKAFIKNKPSRIICGPICEQYEKVKSSGLFLRIHKSHVINIQYVVHVFNNGTIVLEDDTELPSCPKEKEELLRLMEE